MSTELTPAMRRSALIALLNDESMWPPDFRWDFSNYRTCAIGLHAIAFENREPNKRGLFKSIHEELSDIAKALGLSVANAYTIFIFPDWEEKQTTPQIIARRLQVVHDAMKK